MFIVTRFNINQSDQQAHSQQMYNSETEAMKRYYNILATDIDSDNYKYELCQVVRDDGIAIASQVFDNRVPQTEGAE